MAFCSFVFFKLVDVHLEIPFEKSRRSNRLVKPNDKGNLVNFLPVI